MIRTLLTASILIFAPPMTLAEDSREHEAGVHLEEAINRLDINEEKRAEARDVVKQFLEDRVDARKSMQGTGEALPPREEVKAMRVYSDIVLESRLDEVLTSEQIEQFVAHLKAQRRQVSAR